MSHDLLATLPSLHPPPIHQSRLTVKPSLRYLRQRAISRPAAPGSVPVNRKSQLRSLLVWWCECGCCLTTSLSTSLRISFLTTCTDYRRCNLKQVERTSPIPAPHHSPIAGCRIIPSCTMRSHTVALPAAHVRIMCSTPHSPKEGTRFNASLFTAI